MSEDHPTLLTPVALGPVTVRNRVISSSHQTGLVREHLPTDALVAYHRARAAGGVGAIVLEATAVHPTGLLTSHTLGGYLPGIADGYRRLADAVHAHGTRLLVQLFHGGREQISAAPRPPAVAPSAVPSPRFKSEPRALTVRELGELIDGYRAAARLAREGGLDGIELSFSHGYLAAQFFSAASNRRDDDYGLGGRLRFAHEVIAAAREGAGPELALGVRLSADELADGQLDGAGCAEIAGVLAADGAVDFVSLVLGHSASYLASTWIAPPPPVPANAIGGYLGPVRAAVGDTPVIATTRVVDLAAAEALVAGGGADLVGMTRALIADPQLLAKAGGAVAEPLIECVGCNQACIGHYHAGVPIGCAVNARTGSESVLRAPERSASGSGGTRRRVLVIGGGPAGVAAAVEAARWGDEVLLCEREPELGGQLRIAGGAPAHTETWARWRRFTAAQLDAFGVRVRLGQEVTAAPDVGEWDQIVLATGALAYTPPLPGLDGRGVGVISFAAAIADPAAVAGPVLVLDWGADWAGLDAAELLAAAGREVTLVCAALHPGEMLHQYQRALYLQRLHAARVTIVHHTELDRDGSGLRHVFSGLTAPLPACATVVLAQGRVPDDALWALLEQTEGAMRAGDVLGPRGLEEAVLEGTRATYRG